MKFAIVFSPLYHYNKFSQVNWNLCFKENNEGILQFLFLVQYLMTVCPSM